MTLILPVLLYLMVPPHMNLASECIHSHLWGQSSNSTEILCRISLPIGVTFFCLSVVNRIHWQDSASPCSNAGFQIPGSRRSHHKWTFPSYGPHTGFSCQIMCLHVYTWLYARVYKHIPTWSSNSFHSQVKLPVRWKSYRKLWGFFLAFLSKQLRSLVKSLWHHDGHGL